MKINFYKTNDEFGFFSNFYNRLIFVDGLTWKTVEHYFQANKFEDSILIQKIRDLNSPMEAAIEGRKKENIIKANWDDIKDEIMYKALKAKFLQHPDLRIKILETGNEIIVEHTKNDSYWGDGGDGKGENRLGVLLMKVRDEISDISTDKKLILPPWIAFPNIDQEDMFWRMGLGENYLYLWSRYYLSLSNKSNYQHLFIPPDGYEDFYE